MSHDPRYSPTDSGAQPPDRLWDLLADRALGELSAADAAELESLLATSRSADVDALDRAAASLELNSLGDMLEPLPEILCRKVLASASVVVGAEGRGLPSIGPASIPTRRPGWFIRYAPTLAAAAMLIVAFSLWSTKRVPSFASARQSLLASATDAVLIPWTATQDPAATGASGDVIWSSARQAGYMRFKGLAKNDAAVSQYQLWIFDDAQDQRYPVDGGVFNVDASTGDLIVPITAKLRVVHPTLFAVTVEKPGGVVVSDRKRLPLLAKMPMPPGTKP